MELSASAARAGERACIAVGTLHRWHRRLMRHGRLPAHMIGVFPPALGWVGGASPLDAAYVPPPPSEIPRLMDDLIACANCDLLHLWSR